MLSHVDIGFSDRLTILSCWISWFVQDLGALCPCPVKHKYFGYGGSHAFFFTNDTSSIGAGRWCSQLLRRAPTARLNYIDMVLCLQHPATVVVGRVSSLGATEN